MTDKPYSGATQCDARPKNDSQKTKIDTQIPNFTHIGASSIFRAKKSTLQPFKLIFSNPKWTQEVTKSTPRKLNRILDVKNRFAKGSN